MLASYKIDPAHVPRETAIAARVSRLIAVRDGATPAPMRKVHEIYQNVPVGVAETPETRMQVIEMTPSHSSVLRDHPKIARARSTREHRATLLRYVSAMVWKGTGRRRRRPRH
jgi:hypothetical protein